MTYILLIVVLIIAYLIFKGKSQTQKITDDEELERKKNDAYFNQLIEKEPNPKAKEYLTKIKSFVYQNLILVNQNSNTFYVDINGFEYIDQ
jgi:hypothetical protein